MAEQLTLPAGTIVKVNGIPFRLLQETAVEGRAENLQAARDKLSPLLNAFGELHWRSGRGQDVPHEEIEAAFEAVILSAEGCAEHGRVTQHGRVTNAQAALTDEQAMRVVINACDSLNITRVHELGGKTQTICDEVGLLEIARAIEKAHGIAGVEGASNG